MSSYIPPTLLKYKVQLSFSLGLFSCAYFSEERNKKLVTWPRNRFELDSIVFFDYRNHVSHHHKYPPNLFQNAVVKYHPLPKEDRKN